MAKSSNQKPRERDFKGDDSTLIQRSRTVLVHLSQYLSQFTALDSSIDSTFYNDWKAQIDKCENHPTDESVDDELREYSRLVEEARSLCFASANDLQYYVGRAFPDEKRVLQEFGFTERKQARARALNTFLWMVTMEKVAADYTTELTGAGMPGSVVTDLHNAWLNFGNKEADREYFKRKGIRLTRERIDKMNKLYSYLHTAHKAAQLVFANDAERRALFAV